MSGGEGPRTNDWDDYLGEDVITDRVSLTYIRNGQRGYKEALIARIDAESPHFNANCCHSGGPDAWASTGQNYYRYKVVTRNSDIYRANQAHVSDANNGPPGAYWDADATTNITHTHICVDYGAGGQVPTVAEGNAFWNWAYAKYTPVPTLVSGSTAQVNCFAHALHGIDGNVLTYWIEWDLYQVCGVQQALAELAGVRSKGLMGQNSYFDTVPEDRCVFEGHMWIVKASPEQCAGTQLEWKNMSSPVYRWTRGLACNDAPLGATNNWMGEGEPEWFRHDPAVHGLNAYYRHYSIWRP